MSSFQGVQSIITQPHFCGLVVRENIIVGKIWQDKTSHHGIQERERKVQNHIYSPKIMSLVSISFQSVHFLCFYLLSIAHQIMNQLIHSMMRAHLLPQSSLLNTELVTGPLILESEGHFRSNLSHDLVPSHPLDLLTLISIAQIHRQCCLSSELIPLTPDCFRSHQVD